MQVEVHGIALSAVTRTCFEHRISLERCRARVPWWVPEYLRLQNIENDLRSRQMGMGALAPRLGVVGADVITLAQLGEKKPQEPLRLVDQPDQPALVVTCA